MKTLELLKRLEEKGVVFEVEGKTLWVRGNTACLTPEDKGSIKERKSLLIESIQDRERLEQILLEDVEIAPDLRQLSLFVDEAQKAFEAGQLSRAQTERVALKTLDRGRMVSVFTGTKAVLYRDTDEEMKNFPRRASWKGKAV